MQVDKQLTQSSVLPRHGIYSAYKRIRQIDVVVAETFDHVVYVRRDGNLTQSNFPFSIKIDVVGQFRCESSDSVFG